MLEKIKLIIWDLDETLWQGVLSEGEVKLFPWVNAFLQQTTDYGIINSICSKNDPDVVDKKLAELNIQDRFVFNSINWEPKGARIKATIKNMGLRDSNVLFVDDNIQNLEDARFHCPNISVLLADKLDEIIAEAAALPPKDAEHKRLAQYRTLEKKFTEKQVFESNEAFLFSCNIQVEIHRDCLDQIERICELVHRSNQLNYTKKRDSIEELRTLLASDGVDSGYVTVKDRFGDYGLVGFFAVKNAECIHFLFSCRTLGMGIEQYVYASLNYPKLTIVGEVANVVDKQASPPWINQQDKTTTDSSQTQITGKSILLKGPCDLEQMRAFLSSDIPVSCEFSYINDRGILVEGINHLAQMTTILTATDERKQEIAADMPWFDTGMLTTVLAEKKFDFVVFSMLATCNLGVYRRKETGELIALCENFYDLTDENNRAGYVSGEIFSSNIKMTESDLISFAEKYEKIDFLTAEQITDSLDTLLASCGKGHLILVLGTEQKFEGEKKRSYLDRHLLHREVNEIVRNWAKNLSNVSIIEIDKYIHSQNDWTNSFNHYSKKVYFELAGELLSIFQFDKEKIKSLRVGYKEVIKERIISKLRFLKPIIKPLIKPFRKK